MKLRPAFPEISIDNPFANCKLEREPFAKILTSVIDCSEEGFTMAFTHASTHKVELYISPVQQRARIQPKEHYSM